jgi:hypothetical protein
MKRNPPFTRAVGCDDPAWSPPVWSTGFQIAVSLLECLVACKAHGRETPMKHVRRLTKDSVPAPAIFIVEVETKSECKSTVPDGEESECKETVKGGGIYTFVIL